MKSLNKLNLSPLKKTPLNKTISRRMKLLNNLNKQLKYSIILLDGGDNRIENEFNRKVSLWFFLEESGKYFLEIKYGKEVLNLGDKTKKYSIICNDMMEVNKNLGIVKDSVMKGEFDRVLEDVSKNIRSKFKK
jgi:hypothetical protein